MQAMVAGFERRGVQVRGVFTHRRDAQVIDKVCVGPFTRARANDERPPLLGPPGSQ